MSDFVGHFLNPGYELDRLAREAAIGWGTAESLRASRREADRLIREVERLRQTLDANPSGWPKPTDGANYFVPRPGRQWEQGRDAAEWQVAFRAAIDDLIDLYKAMVENCFALGPGALPAGADEATFHKRNEASQRALEEHHAWLKDRAELENQLHQFRNDILSFQLHAQAPGQHASTPAGPADTPPDETTDTIAVTETDPASEVTPRHPPSEAKKSRTAKRHRIITSLLEQGFGKDGEQILEHMKLHYPELVWVKKPQGQNPPRFILARPMMTKYRGKK